MVYLEEIQYENLTRLAKRQKKSFASLLREAVDLYLKRVKRRHSKKKDPIWDIVGMGRARRKNDDAASHDKILYLGSK